MPTATNILSSPTHPTAAPPQIADARICTNMHENARFQRNTLPRLPIFIPPRPKTRAPARAKPVNAPPRTAPPGATPRHNPARRRETKPPCPRSPVRPSAFNLDSSFEFRPSNFPPTTSKLKLQASNHPPPQLLPRPLVDRKHIPDPDPR